MGRSLLRAIGESDLKAISLELGGKSPQVVLADVGDLDAAVEAIGWGIFYNSGPDLQRRLAARRPSLASREELVERLAAFGARARARRTRWTRRPSSARSSTSASWRRCSATSSSGREEGARVVAGGERVRAETGGAYIPPTILDGVTNAMRVAREEIFGPVLAVTEFDDEDEAVAHRQRHAVRPGGRAVDPRRQPRPPAVARGIRAGVVWVNTFDAADITVPFGGFKQSGFGRDKGLPALDGYTQLKTTWFDLSGEASRSEGPRRATLVVRRNRR